MAKRAGRAAKAPDEWPHGPDDIRTIFAKNLRETRDKKNLTQKDIVRACGGRYATIISKIEAGRNVTLETLQLLARALQVTEAELLQRPPKPTTQTPE
jgi:transcriptional regulator with XRE-family HTH domain